MSLPLNIGHIRAGTLSNGYQTVERGKATRRQIHSRICRYCEHPFDTKNSNKVFCSSTCRMDQWRGKDLPGHPHSDVRKAVEWKMKKTAVSVHALSKRLDGLAYGTLYRFLKGYAVNDRALKALKAWSEVKPRRRKKHHGISGHWVPDAI